MSETLGKVPVRWVDYSSGISEIIDVNGTSVTVPFVPDNYETIAVERPEQTEVAPIQTRTFIQKIRHFAGHIVTK